VTIPLITITQELEERFEKLEKKVITFYRCNTTVTPL
jgi:hypothetical protein